MLIALTGPRGVGKDTVGGLIVAKSKRVVTTFAFADKLKQTMATLFDLPLHLFHDQSLKEEVIDSLGMSPRDIMIKADAPLKTAFGEDVFVWAAGHAYSQTPSDHHFLVTDLRFPPYEEGFVRSHGGLVIHVQRYTGKPKLGHYSEDGIEIREGDLVLDNNGSLGDLEDAVCEIVKRYDL